MTAVIGTTAVPNVVEFEQVFHVEQNDAGREATVEEFRFVLDADECAPELEVGHDYRIVVDGEDYGERWICCMSTGPGGKGSFTLKARWEG